jgi:hypothetical protein
MKLWLIASPKPILLAFTVRGHRPVRHGLDLPPDALEEWSRRNRLPGGQKRFKNAALAAIAVEMLESGCRRRGGELLDVVAFSSGLLAIVRVRSGSEWGLRDATRLLTTRAARRRLGWPRDESVFTRNVHWIELPDEPALAAAAERIRMFLGR